jgi:hypothetical protein
MINTYLCLNKNKVFYFYVNIILHVTRLGWVRSWVRVGSDWPTSELSFDQAPFITFFAANAQSKFLL